MDIETAAVNKLLDDFRKLSSETQKLVLDVLKVIMEEQEDKNET